jgi:hypothetical protein
LTIAQIVMFRYLWVLAVSPDCGPRSEILKTAVQTVGWQSFPRVTIS